MSGPLLTEFDSHHILEGCSQTLFYVTCEINNWVVVDDSWLVPILWPSFPVPSKVTAVKSMKIPTTTDRGESYS